jgi:hypothetical protein
VEYRIGTGPLNVALSIVKLAGIEGLDSYYLHNAKKEDF